MMFMNGVDMKQYGHLMKDLETDYSLLKKDVYPDTIKAALQVLIMYSEKALKRKEKKAKAKAAGKRKASAAEPRPSKKARANDTTSKDTAAAKKPPAQAQGTQRRSNNSTKRIFLRYDESSSSW